MLLLKIVEYKKYIQEIHELWPNGPNQAKCQIIFHKKSPLLQNFIRRTLDAGVQLHTVLFYLICRAGVGYIQMTKIVMKYLYYKLLCHNGQLVCLCERLLDFFL